ncbi:MAG: hypothetical protein KBB39_05180 [Phycicoccus sp.]|nr:hypothetical protein [Phycicoccus sp.]
MTKQPGGAPLSSRQVGLVVALTAMPLRLGRPAFQLNLTSRQSPMGHLVFGAILGGFVT